MNARPTSFEIFVTAMCAIGVCAATVACANGAVRIRGAEDSADGVQSRARPNVASARELDQEGVRRFHEGRYADAIHYFRVAYRMGGPSSELWNIARSQEKLDDPEAACANIDEYLAQRDLSAQDRAEAEREARALRARPSVLTVITMPVGALVSVDGAQVPGSTPISIEILPGRHAISVRHDGYSGDVRAVEARFGRAVIVSLDLAPGRK